MRGLAAAVLIVGLGLAACGGDDVSSETPGEAVSRVEAIEFGFTPDLWTGDAAGTFTIEFTNAGSIVHNWVVLSQRVESEDEITDAIKLFSVTTSAGETLSAQVPQLDAGTYQVVCDIAGHFSAGMEGELRIGG